MENTVKTLKKLGLGEQGLAKLTAILTKQNYPKGHILIREGRTERFLYFLEQGIARVFFQKDDKEVTFCFNWEGDILLSVKSYFANEPGYESIELLENSVVYRISLAELQTLYQTDIELANWGRKLAENEFVKADQRFMAQQFKSATERYEDFVKTYPDLHRRIQLGHIAAYLGISQVTLSRIRSEAN